ncbi:MAG: type II toxin-antitoxin system PemK/MazF family toxin [Candidatus Anammoxibacter sp.]
MPSYSDLLVCGISKQLNQYIKDFDEILSSDHADFKSSGLLSESLIRLSFLAVLPQNQILGTIGEISTERHKRLLTNLADYLMNGKPKVTS